MTISLNEIPYKQEEYGVLVFDKQDGTMKDILLDLVTDAVTSFCYIKEKTVKEIISGDAREEKFLIIKDYICSLEIGDIIKDIVSSNFNLFGQLLFVEINGVRESFVQNPSILEDVAITAGDIREIIIRSFASSAAEIIKIIYLQLLNKTNVELSNVLDSILSYINDPSITGTKYYLEEELAEVVSDFINYRIDPRDIEYITGTIMCLVSKIIENNQMVSYSGHFTQDTYVSNGYGLKTINFVYKIGDSTFY